MFDYRQFTTFVREREEKILERIKKSIGVKDAELDYSVLFKNDEE